ncbi:hypothetical protein CKAN_02297300 [Cinnamomum micranthum f. kanehirae]|uniref:Uncharacterized protein n=1 Tax=Cinnamomum micranthum f. kanehirae TaxID=337451 RepID=A0A3S3N0W9_9MAGN|nr:hypothetical protein CKAN_02297300 [Cinnamomum micranthum f. kanehirae]
MDPILPSLPLPPPRVFRGAAEGRRRKDKGYQHLFFVRNLNRPPSLPHGGQTLASSSTRRLSSLSCRASPRCRDTS